MDQETIAWTLEIVSASTGLLGAYWLATKSRWAPWAWLVWLISNVGWIAFSVSLQRWGLMAQNVGFMVTSALGVKTWLLDPYLVKLRDERQQAQQTTV